MPSKIGASCSRNEDCSNKNCVTGKCTRKTAKKTQKKTSSAPKKIGEPCNTNKDCKNNNCVSKKCSRKTSKKTQKSPSPVRKVSPPKSPSPSSSSSIVNNAAAKSLIVTYKPGYSDLSKIRKAGLVDGDVVIVDKELRKQRIEAGEIEEDDIDQDDHSNSYYIVSGKDRIYVGINKYDTFYQFDFPEKSTKYTTNFFKKYKNILKQSEQNDGVYELRHDDKFIKKYFNNTTSKNIYKVNIDSDYDDESEGNIQISESSRTGDILRRQDIEGDLRTILRSV